MRAGVAMVRAPGESDLEVGRGAKGSDEGASLSGELDGELNGDLLRHAAELGHALQEDLCGGLDRPNRFVEGLGGTLRQLRSVTKPAAGQRAILRN